MKELVDHIRTVHFTVFVVALVLTMSARGHKKPQLERAASDAEAILLLEQKWPAVKEAFIREVDSAFNRGAVAFVSGNNARPLDVDNPGLYKISGHDVYPNRPLIFEVRRKWIYVDGTEADENPGWGESDELTDRVPSGWKNLKEFFDFWDGYHDGRRAFVAFELATGQGEKYCGDLRKIGETERKVPVTAFLVLHAIFKDGWQLSFNVEGMDRDVNIHKHACEFAPVSVSQWKGDVGAVFAGIATQARKWGNGKSNDEFKDLVAEARYLEELPVAKLAGALRERANADTDRVELFQAKLPVEAIATYGALLLITCQLYLLAHLIELRRVTQQIDRADWPTGYIGLYEDPVISVFTFVSLVVWPPFPLFLLARSSAAESSVLYNGWSALIVSTGIAIASAVMLALVRKTDTIKANAVAPSTATDGSQ